MISLREAMISAATLSLGLLIGVVATRPKVATPSEMIVTPNAEPGAKPPACETSDEELRIACLPLMLQAAGTLHEAETKVEALTVRVREKETEVTRLEVAMSGTATSRTDIEVELQRARDDLARLHAELKEALTAREVITATLTQTEAVLAATRQELSDQRQATRDARDDAATQRWSRFVSDTQLKLCSEGARDRLESCRSAVAASVAPMQRRYKDCIRSGQAIPELKATKGDAALPEFAEQLDVANAATRGWYVLFCDPELPEARGGGGKSVPLDDPRLFRLQATARAEPTTD